MKLNIDLDFLGREYPKGSEVPWYFIFPFFLFHMAVFGGASFMMAYGSSGPNLLALWHQWGRTSVRY